MNVQDIRPSCSAACSPEASGYRALREDRLTPEGAAALLPDRPMLAMVWRYLAGSGCPIEESPICLCRKIVRWSGKAMGLGQMMTCLDIFQDVGLLTVVRRRKKLSIQVDHSGKKADLNTSKTMQRLLKAKES